MVGTKNAIKEKPVFTHCANVACSGFNNTVETETISVCKIAADIKIVATPPTIKAAPVIPNNIANCAP